MARQPSSKRYAQALFQLAQEQGTLDEWLGQMREAQSALADPTVTAYLGSPRVRLEQKVEIVSQLLVGLDKFVVNTIGLLVSRRAFSSLDNVVGEYAALLDITRGRVQATATSAVGLSDEQRSRLEGHLSKMLGKEVVLGVREDSALIGGIVVKVGDQVIDGSVRTRLQLLRRSLVEQPVG